MKKSNNDKLTPDVRFRGYTDDWKQRRLGEICEAFSGGTPSVTNKLYYDGCIPFIRSAEINCSNTELSISNEGLKNSSAKLVKKGNILYALYGATSGEVGISKINGAINQAILAIIPMDEYDTNFIAQWLKFNKRKIINKYLQGGQGNLSGLIIKNLTLQLPKKNEQQKVGTFFKQLDSLITLLQRKQKQLEQLKKAMLQKMFPKKECQFPEVRFNGFRDAWEQRKLGKDILSIHTGTNLLGSKTNEGIPLIKMGNLQNGFFDFSKIEHLPLKASIDKQDILNYGDFLFNTRNTLELVGKGATWISELDRTAFNSNIAKFILKSDINTIFFNYLYNTDTVSAQIHARATGTTSVAAIYPNSLNNLVYRLPFLQEQEKIGMFFKNIDNLITFNQQKLNYLTQLKKYLLQKMFI